MYGGAARRDPDALLHGSLARFVEPPSMRGYLGQLYAITGWTSLPWLRRLQHPTLVLAGDDDPIVPLVNGRILARCIPDARLHVVRSAGHLFLLERPAEMAAARVCATWPPAIAPTTNPPMAVSEAARDSPECGSAVKPRNTTFPVMLATNTCPSRK